MVERGGELGLGDEAAAEVGILRQLVVEHLERDGAVERQVGGAVDDAHAAAADAAVDAVAGELLGDEGIGHPPVLLRAPQAGKGRTGVGDRLQDAAGPAARAARRGGSGCGRRGRARPRRSGSRWSGGRTLRGSCAWDDRPAARPPLPAPPGCRRPHLPARDDPGMRLEAAYDRSSVTPGVVHIGVGGFHRAHQAMYHDRLLRAGARDWGICGVGVLDADRAHGGRHARAARPLHARGEAAVRRAPGVGDRLADRVPLRARRPARR